MRNAATTGVMPRPPTIAAAIQRRLSRDLSAINYISDNLELNYNGSQATLTKRISRGLSFMAGYTYSHALEPHFFQ